MEKKSNTYYITNLFPNKSIIESDHCVE